MKRLFKKNNNWLFQLIKILKYILKATSLIINLFILFEIRKLDHSCFKFWLNPPPFFYWEMFTTLIFVLYVCYLYTYLFIYKIALETWMLFRNIFFSLFKCFLIVVLCFTDLYPCSSFHHIYKNLPFSLSNLKHTHRKKRSSFP